jgi:phenylalanyl-tRNA synthetase beta chain
MRAPLSWLKEFVDIPASLSAEDISQGLVRVGFEVEEVIYQGKDVQGPLSFGEVLSIEEITEYKKPIRYVGLDCGEGQTRYVICGATNFAVGDIVLVALPGAVLPGDFAIAARETYGKTSNGMICSSRELALSDEHAGIMVFDKEQVSVKDDVRKTLQIEDVVFDIAVNPDRGYALSIRGVAREIAGAFDLKFVDPIEQVRGISFKDTGKGVQPKIEDKESASIFYLRTLSHFDSSALTPLWMRRRIEKMGMRSISLVVDITNYVMLEFGQPLHAFDRSKIKGALRVKRAEKSEKFTTLDGQERVLDPLDLVISDDHRALALAGTMGGLHSEITDQTTEIALEAVRFNPVAIAQNSRRHRISSEASRRLERGVDPSLAELASARFVQLLTEHSSAQHVETVCVGAANYPSAFLFDPADISKILGFEVKPEEVIRTLKIVGCDIDKKWNVTPPSWRPDLLSTSDLAEEVARLIGYDSIPSILPDRPLHAALTTKQKRRRKITQFLANRGFAEVLTFPFTNQKSIDELGFLGPRATTYALANPMSEENPLLRVHIVPGLLEVAARNTSRGAKDFAIFEVGSIFRSTQKLEKSISPETNKRPSDQVISEIFASVPMQTEMLAALMVGKKEVEDWQGTSEPYTWRDAIAFSQEILELCHLEYEVKRSDLAPWHPGRCAELLVNGVVVMHAGEIHPRILAQYGLPPRSSAFGINMTLLPDAPMVRPTRVGVMPAATQDVALVVDAHVSADDVLNALKEGAGPLLESISLFDRYDKIGDGKLSLAFTLTFRSEDRTLTGEEVSEMRESATALAAKRCGAVVRTA